MSAGSYTYTSISAGPGEPTRVGVSFYLGERSFIALCGAGTDRPHLAVSQGDVSASIAPRAEKLTARDAAIARTFAEQAALYAAEVERLCTATESGIAAA